MKCCAKLLVSLLLMMGLSGCVSQWEAREAAEKYYSGMVEQDYDRAFSQLLLFKEYVDQPGEVSKKEAKDFFYKKMDYLESQDDRIMDFKIKGTYKHEPHLPQTQVTALVTVHKGKDKRTYRETLQVTENGLFIDHSDDKMNIYRDGEMAVDIPSE
ncbi:hypothetical protein C8P63_14215 [Melghirimyces profundicolus]|uniref:Uncharacterized protein n=1 Tax=Melghirimyces profundicolus TaxID=1242148 RepID=A0A2T6AZD4_9BACL|nr:hypothetical protein [Melghirimyces profundicolus]PTX49158.1 hypothetical protein C8P63_14215 [Melghirimyces profundicolus]